MSAANLAYRLQTFTGLTGHGWQKAAFMRDASDEQSSGAKLGIDAQVRSGDYFVTLATTLDLLGKNASDYQVRADLEDLVSDLIYLQDNYTITKNERPE